MSSARAVGISISTDSTTITMDDELRLVITLQGIKDTNHAPKISGIENFEMRGTNSSSSISIVNTNIQVSRQITYSLVPKKMGKFELGPVTLDYRGRKLTSNKLSISVGKGYVDNGSGNTGTVDKNRKYFIMTTVSNKSPYVGEQVIYHFQFFTRVDVQGAGLEESPDFKGFWKEDLGNTKERTKRINGQLYEVTEFKKALFPNAAGELTIGKASLITNVPVSEKRRRRRGNFFLDSFLGNIVRTKRIRLTSQPIKMTVLPLPTEGKPPNFSNGVGLYKIKGSLSKNIATVGESTTLTLEVTGKGNVRDVKLPKINLDGFKVYADKPQFTLHAQGDSIFGRKVFKMALVPQTQGLNTIAPIKLHYFNPQTKKYEVVSTQALQIQVSPSSDDKDIAHVKGTDVSARRKKKKIKVLGQDLMPIKRDVYNLTNDRVTLVDKIIFAIAVFFIPIIYLITFVLMQRHQRFKNDIGHQRRSVAYKKYLKNSKGLKTDDPKVLEKYSNTLRQYVGDKLNIDGLALTPIDVERRLSLKNVSQELTVEVKNFLRTCEMGTYSGGGVDAVTINALKEQLSLLIKRAEKEIR